MKKLLFITTLLLFVGGIFAASKVDVYYFHYARRCVTCQSVEMESQKILKELYANEIKAGNIQFTAVNLDEKGGKALARKCKAEGQSLLVISQNKRFDLTEQGFMYARTQREKLKSEIKKTIDPLLK